MKKAKKILSLVLAVVMCFGVMLMTELSIEAEAASETTLSAMRERAEAIINYKWIPSQNISTWNNNTYNGRNYFKKGETVIGMPYTLFTTEVVSFSLLSLSQYKSKASSNYSTTAYCVSTGSNRTGPVYGSCCADFVCEVFGGKFMNGNSMRYHNVSNIKSSSYGTTTYNVKASNIKAGDAVSNTAGTHIVWIGEVADSYFMIYEQTPPVAKKTKVYKSSAINSNGYLVFGGSVYNIVTKSKEFTEAPSKPTLSVSDKNTSDKAVVFTWNKTANTSQYDLRIYNYGDYNVAAPYGIWDLNVTTTSGYHKLPAGKYAAYITAVSSSGVETPSEWITFDVVDPPGKSVLTATPGRMITDGVSFTWTKAANAHTYDLRVYNYGDYNVGAPYYKFGMSASTTSTTIKLPAGKYSAYITTIASNGAYEGGDSAWISFTVSEPTVDSNYPSNIKGHKMWIGATATQVFDTQTLSGYYLDDNEITVTTIYTNDWAKIKHTVDGIEKTAYIPLSGLICDKVQPYKMYLKNNSNIYSRYTCETKQNSQLKDKEVLVIGFYKTEFAQICYTINNTSYMGWIEKEQLIDHVSTNHTYVATVTTQPTCTKEGIKTYKCSCGANYAETIAKKAHVEIIDNAVSATCTKTGLTEGKKCSVCGTITVVQQTVAKKSHIDNNGDYKCDYGCGYAFEKPAPDSPSTPDEPENKPCSCNCHKGGISGFFFKLINFFEKLFGKNKVCACGVKH